MFVYADQKQRVSIGRLGENEARVIAFDVSEILAEHPDAIFALLNQRAKDNIAYPVNSFNFTVENGKLLWTVSSGDLTQVGQGQCEIVAYENTVVVKTVIYQTFVDKALDGSGEVPEPWESWVQDITDAANSIMEAADEWNNMTASAITLEPGTQATAEYNEGHLTIGVPEGIRGEKGDKGDQGEKGDRGDVGFALFGVDDDMQLFMCWDSGASVPMFALNDNMELEVVL